MPEECTFTNSRRIRQVGAVRFVYRLANLDEFSDRGLLIAMGHFAQAIGVGEAFHRHIQLNMRMKCHAPVDKLLTFFISLVDGCGYTSDIDDQLRPYPAVATAWGLATGFADQGLVNDTLHALKPEHLVQIEELFQELFQHHSLSLRQPLASPLVADVDLMGLPLSRKSLYVEGATAGYFVQGPGHEGLQFAAVFIGEGFREVLGGHLAPGNAHILAQWPGLLAILQRRLGRPQPRRALLQQHVVLQEAEAHRLLTQAHTTDRQVITRWEQVGAQLRKLEKHQARLADLEQRSHRFPQRAARYQEQMTEEQRLIAGYQSRVERNRATIQARQDQIAARQQQAQGLQQEAARLRALAQEPPAAFVPRFIIVRADSHMGTAAIVTVLCELGYFFVVKGYNPDTAHMLAQEITNPQDWLAVDHTLQVAEAQRTRITDCPFPLRIVVGRRTHADGPETYYHLLSNLPASFLDTRGLVQFYNGRQTIEAFNKVSGNVIHFRHLRTRKLVPNEAVVQLGLLAYDFWSWAADEFFAGTEYEGLGMRELVTKGLHVMARVTWAGHDCVTELSIRNPYAQAFVKGPALPPGQLPLPFMDEEATPQKEN
jgi:hypothetical protein